jgi:hypothetical protein
MIPQELIAAIGKLLRDMPRNPTAIEVGEALNRALASQSNRSLDKANKAPFDKKTYQRDLMRKRRAAEKRRRQQESTPAEK